MRTLVLIGLQDRKQADQLISGDEQALHLHQLRRETEAISSSWEVEDVDQRNENRVVLSDFEQEESISLGQFENLLRACQALEAILRVDQFVDGASVDTMYWSPLMYTHHPLIRPNSESQKMPMLDLIAAVSLDESDHRTREHIYRTVHLPVYHDLDPRARHKLAMLGETLELMHSWAVQESAIMDVQTQAQLAHALSCGVSPAAIMLQNFERIGMRL